MKFKIKVSIFLILTILISRIDHALAQQQKANGVAYEIVAKSAKALGGVERIANLHSLTLQGYAQYAYMWGGGNISSAINAPEKLIAANELIRTWNFDEDAFQLKERRNMLFPFAGAFGHLFLPVNQVLQKTTAFDLMPNGKSVLVPIFTENPLYIDGSRVRKLWSLTNPVAMLNALLTNKVKVTNVVNYKKETILSVSAGENIELKFTIDNQTNIPLSVSWKAPHSVLAEVSLTTSFSGYMPYEGIMLPMGYTTKIDFRDVVYLRMFVDGYRVNTSTGNLKIPDSLLGKTVLADSAPKIEVETLGKGIWKLTGGTTIIEFKDHLVAFELYGNQLMGKAILEKANTLVSGKKVTSLIVSHHHFDHTGGFRAGVAAGLKVYSHRNNEGILREIANRKAPDFNDVLKSSGNFDFVPIDEELTLKDEMATLKIYHVISNNHMADAVFGYLPEQKIFIDADIATAAADWQLWPDSYQNNLDYYQLKVDKVSSVHERTMTHQEILKFIEEGKQRAIKRDSTYRERGEYLPGYPVFYNKKNN
ncbi:hypothetical protein SAMN04487898_11543 [Pedobacter sp. ok626]|uniref:hypothetical protein n=1 Tax=Pedobacter sp. ok626 TaxID=1761882 RepID=UPI00088B35D1|nr:hypothetical protein [Pedobacter sp. ok626]SDL11612.1 hypothetical protein SAMN04487898_11543 [Pedobacter sp. ok626]